MKIEDLVPGNKYRHPDYNFNLSFYRFSNYKDDIHPGLHIFLKKNGIWVFLDSSEISALKEVREPIRREQVSYSVIEEIPSTGIIDKYCRVLGLKAVGHSHYTLIEAMEFKENLRDDIYDANNLVVIKTTAYSKELTEKEIQEILNYEKTEEKIQKEIENER